MSTSKVEAVALPPRMRLREAVALLRTERAHSRILSGSVILLVGSGVVTAFNFAYNVAIAHMLGPAAFGHASAAVTLLMLISAITLSFQLVCAKFVARNEVPGAKANVYHVLFRKSWIVSIALAAGIALASTPITHYLNLPTRWIVLLMAAAALFYIPVGVKRGGLQGTYAFSRLNLNMILEVAVKFGLAVLLVAVGYGVIGAVGAITASVMAAYFLLPMRRRMDAEPLPGKPASFREGMQAIVFFVGQVIINNVDILVVKHFFGPAEAGLYAGVALVGRVLYYAAWQVVSAMFPVSAGAKTKPNDPSMLAVPLLLVVGISVTAILVLTYFPGPIIQVAFGSAFREAQSLLSLQAAATGCYSLAVVLMAYEMSRKIANTGWLQLAFSVAIVAGISWFHSTLREVVIVQVVLRVLLLMAVSLPFFRTRHGAMQEAAA